MMKRFAKIVLILMLLALTGCNKENEEEVAVIEEAVTENVDEVEEIDAMKLKIDGTEVPVTWEENSSVETLKEMSPLTVEMSMYGGFEQVGSIGKSIAKDDKQITTNYGDIVLYSGNQIVIFYGSNSWAYTRLGHIDMSQEELTDMLGSKNVTVTLEK